MGQTPYGARRERVEHEDDPQHAELINSPTWPEQFAPNEKLKRRVDHSNVLNCANHTLHRSAVSIDGCKHQPLGTWRGSFEPPSA